MKPIEIEDDIYDYLLSQSREIGETASSILRRELPGLLGVALSTNHTKHQPISPSHELTCVLGSAKMKVWNTTDKYLLILSEAYKQKPSEFDKILQISGRDRKYFAPSKGEIEGSGTSTQPKQIPASPYWALTNLTTLNKQGLLRQALKLLGYSTAAAKDASEAIA